MKGTQTNLLIQTLEAIQSKPQIPINKQRWATADCAEFMRLKPKYFSENIACKPNFPEPIRIKIDKGPGKKKGIGHPTWLMNEVIDWYEKQ